MTPLELHDGVFVKREDISPHGFPSGKLRGLIPYLEQKKSEGVKLIVNAGATHSNSHAITAFAASAVGLRAVTFVNTDKPNANVMSAERYGAKVEATKPTHLSPLLATARKYAEQNGGLMLPWGLSCAEIVRHYATAVDELPKQNAPTIHVVPFGAGGWAAGVWLGVYQLENRDEVIAVAVMPTKTDREKLAKIISGLKPSGFGFGTCLSTTLPQNARVLPTEATEETPWPSDEKYEHAAWPTAKALALRYPSSRVVFWSIGRKIIV